MTADEELQRTIELIPRKELNGLVFASIKSGTLLNLEQLTKACRVLSLGALSWDELLIRQSLLSRNSARSSTAVFSSSPSNSSCRSSRCCLLATGSCAFAPVATFEIWDRRTSRFGVRSRLSKCRKAGPEGEKGLGLSAFRWYQLPAFQPSRWSGTRTRGSVVRRFPQLRGRYLKVR